ncbi:MAG: sigma-54-dependent Fis family transcriptional regulator, partial [Spirochaetes bacterium]|nr:sigma-54-dependent Fis family transcriptional regulator [Spirochaetota bacterium]
ADKGTIFLDEISEIPVHLQAKLLRVIEYKEVQQLGNTKHVKVDVRIIAATNTELENEVSEGRFREDLYYRLNQVPIELPGLDCRREDIPGFIRMFKEEIEKRNGLAPVVFSDKAIDYLKNREYKGNIRELRNLTERLVILSNTGVIDIETIKQIDKRKYE